MAFFGMVFPVGSLMIFGYWNVPWWMIVALTVALLLGGAWLIEVDVWDDVNGFCGIALTVSGLFLFYGIGTGGLDEALRRPSWIVLLFSLVYVVLMKTKSEHDARYQRRLKAGEFRRKPSGEDET